MDYEGLEEAECLFLSDSLKSFLGRYVAFSKPEYDLIKSIYPGDFVTSASVKCPNIKEKDMGTEDQKICRQHLEDTIDKIKPKLVFVCGNLPMKMLLKKSGITDKRGRSYEYSTPNGHKCTVVPIFNPYSVVVEPKNKFLFESDIKNAHEFVISGKRTKATIEYKALLELSEVEELAQKLEFVTTPVSCDTETEGLNFRTDKILTVAFSHGDDTWVIPYEHKDSPFKGDDLLKLVECFNRILMNPRNRKIFQNGQFDMKFFLTIGVKVVNPWDTKIMHHCLDENLPRSLKQMVKLYFPEYLEIL
jgi:hypothetical protein